MLETRLSRIGLTSLIAYVLARSIAGASAKALWFDEICTLIISARPNLHAILGCLWQAMDGQPPVFYLIEKYLYISRLTPEVALRVPSILAVAVTVGCVFDIVRKRVSPGIAFICTASFLLTSAFSYAVEARPYALMVMATSAALLAYQRASSKWWLLVFGVSLFFGECVHYYMIFVLGVFGIAELMLVLKSRIFRPVIWASIAVSVIPLIACWPLLANLKAVYGSHLWNAPSIRIVAGTYGSLLNLNRWTGVLSGMVIVVLSLSVIFWRQTWSEPIDPDGTPLYCERVVIAGLTLLPCFEYVIAKITGGGYTVRYALPLILVTPIVLSYYFQRSRRSVYAVAVIALGFLCLREGSFWRWRVFIHPDSAYAAHAIEKLSTESGHSDLPVVFADGLNYLQSFYYAGVEWRQRFFYVADSKMALRYGTSDSIELNLLRLKACFPVQPVALNEFLSRHSAFLLNSAPEFGDHWWVEALTAMGYSVTRVSTDGVQSMYLIEKEPN